MIIIIFNGMHDYREAMIASNLLPLLYPKVLKDLLLFWKIISGNYDNDFSEFLQKSQDTPKYDWKLRDTTFCARQDSE